MNVYKRQFTKKKREHFIFKHFDEKTLEKAINCLIYGVEALSYSPKTKKIEKVIIYIGESKMNTIYFLFFAKKKMKRNKLKVYKIHNIAEIWPSGQIDKERCISIITASKKSSFYLKFPCLEKKMLFWEGVQYFFHNAKETNVKSLKSKSFSSEWANLKKDEKPLKFLEIESLLLSHDVQFNKKFLKYMLKEMFSLKKNKELPDFSIPFHAYKTLMINFCLKYEIQDIFTNYSKGSEDGVIYWDKKMMSRSEFNTFLIEEQKESPNVSSNDKPFLSFIQFCNYLCSETNSIFDPTKLSLYQDMNEPLHNYFVNSSHNTYLLGNQFTGESSTEAYINAFTKGCRCIEIDCWDGPKNTPMVTHGNTLTSKISFESVIRCVNDYGFKYSPFPIIISIENHCCIEQQEVMAKLMKEIFAEKIWTPDLTEKYSFPSPNDLKNKILVKSKGLPIVEMKRSDPELESNGFHIKVGKVMFQSEFMRSQQENYNEEDFEDSRFLIPSVPIFSPKIEEWQTYRNLSQLLPQRNNRTVLTQEEVSPKQIHIFSSLDNNKNIVHSFNTKDYCPEEQEIREQTPVNMLKIPNFESIFEKENNDDKKMEEKIENNINHHLESATPLSKITSPKNQKKVSRASYLLSFLVSPKHSHEKEITKRNSQISNGSSHSTIVKVKSTHVSICLHEMLALFGYKLKSFEKQVKVYEIASFSEKKLSKFLSKEYINIIELNKRSFTRLYPKGSRIDSSNYDPVPGFLCGVQFTALNFQTHDTNLAIYLSYFQQNGGIHSGYVLKPEFLRNKILDQRVSALFLSPEKKPKKSLMDSFIPFRSKNEINFTEVKNNKAQETSLSPVIELTIQILSAFQIVDHNGKLLKEPFYVEFFMRGFLCDENTNKKYISPYMNDFLHPVFENAKNNFSFIFPGVAFLVFLIYKKSQGSKPLAFYSIPVKCIREGYRRVPLFDNNLNEIKGTYLLCHIKMQTKK